jgi:hypothetical protein
MARKDIFKNGKKTQFSSENQPDNRGRKSSVLKSLEPLYSNEDINKILRTYILDSSFEEMMELVKDKSLPAIVTLVLSAFLQDTKKGSVSSAMAVLDRVYGKPIQQIKVDEINVLPNDIAKLKAMEKYLDEKARLLDEPDAGRKDHEAHGESETPSS